MEDDFDMNELDNLFKQCIESNKNDDEFEDDDLILSQSIHEFESRQNEISNNEEDKKNNCSGKHSADDLFGELSSDEDNDFSNLPTQKIDDVNQLKKEERNFNEKNSIFKMANSNNKKQTKTKDQSKDKEVVLVDPYSGLRIINPLISSAEMKARMDGRKMVKMSLIKTHFNKSLNDIEGDWVTIGIIINKVDPKVSKNGKKFSIFKLSDLKTEKMVSFFLFGEVHSQHWKLPVGTVIGLLNPNFLPENRDNQSKNANDLCSLTIDNYAKLMVIGVSLDFGFCKGIKRGGQQCTNVINKNDSEYCLYHIGNAYKRMSSKRADLQSSFANVGPKREFLKNNKSVSLMSDLVFESDDVFDGEFAVTNSIKPKAIEELPTVKINNQQFKMKKSVENESLNKILTTPFTAASKNLSVLLKKPKDTTSKNDSFTSIKSFKDVLTVIQNKSTKTSDNRSRFFDNFPKQNLSLNQPKLARGFRPGEMIELTVNDAKQKAIEIIKRKPIEKEDPNSVSKKRKIGDAITKSLSASNISNHNNHVLENSKESEGKKRKRDLIEAALKRRSNHEDEIVNVEREAEERYFNAMERKEKLENKLSSITQMTCDVVTCKTCKYTALSASDLCKNKNHKLIFHKSTKKFFKCQNCNNRTYTFGKFMPTTACSKCGGSSYEPTSMYQVYNLNVVFILWL